MTKTIIPISPSWPVWTNAPVHLYHGTIVSSAKAILADGIEVTRGRAATDFGRGFYTTTDEENARMWSRRRARKLRGEASVIRLTLSRVALSKLEHIVFIRSEVSAVDYWSFVANCRSGLPHRPETSDFYDVAYGPVAKAWFGASNSVSWADYDQISFHTQTAQDMLNEASICALEPLP